MKRFLAILIFLPLLFQSCNDGDIIITTFNFDDVDLKTCGSFGNYVFYKVNPDAQESLSLKLNLGDSIYNKFGETIYNLNSTNILVNYRTYDGLLGSDYFCNSIPPTSPNVTVDYIATSGTAVVTVTIRIEDNDGVPEEFEFEGDTDGDGLPDIYDFDDDGDNVPTARELNLEDLTDNDPKTNPKDTDLDGILDYLDKDDDDDLVITRFEDENMNMDPTDDKTDPTVGPDYLNPAVANTYEVKTSLLHKFQIYKTVQITLKNLVLVRGDEQIIIETLNMGTIEDVEIQNKEFTPPPL